MHWFDSVVLNLSGSILLKFIHSFFFGYIACVKLTEGLCLHKFLSWGVWGISLFENIITTEVTTLRGHR